MVNLYHSRRAYFKECKYWLRDENTAPSKWVLENLPTGIFYAKEVGNETRGNKVVNNAFMFDANNVMLETQDDIADMTRGAVIEYKGELWIVDTIQRTLHTNEQQFCNKETATWYLSIRK